MLNEKEPDSFLGSSGNQKTYTPKIAPSLPVITHSRGIAELGNLPCKSNWLLSVSHHPQIILQE